MHVSWVLFNYGENQSSPGHWGTWPEKVRRKPLSGSKQVLLALCSAGFSKISQGDKSFGHCSNVYSSGIPWKQADIHLLLESWQKLEMKRAKKDKCSRHCCILRDGSWGDLKSCSLGDSATENNSRAPIGTAPRWFHGSCCDGSLWNTQACTII